jgi:hypothetical protein
MSCQLIEFFQDNRSALGYNSVVRRQLSSNQLSTEGKYERTYRPEFFTLDGMTQAQ